MCLHSLSRSIVAIELRHHPGPPPALPGEQGRRLLGQGGYEEVFGEVSFLPLARQAHMRSAKGTAFISYMEHQRYAAASDDTAIHR